MRITTRKLKLRPHYFWLCGLFIVGGLTNTDQTFYTSDEPAGASKVTDFNVGVGVPPTLPADTYSTEVTITAIATE